MSAQRKRHVIYLDWPLGQQAGGPSGYLWHLREGLRANGDDGLVTFIAPDHASVAPSPHRRSLKTLIDRLKPVDPLWRTVKTFGPTIVSAERHEFLSTPLDRYFLPEAHERLFADETIGAVHCHTTLDALRMHNSLARLGRRRDVRLILTSHCPEMPAAEKTALLVSNGLLPALAPRIEARLTALDLAAFAAADELVFPCVEAREPYAAGSARFDEIADKKPVTYILSGIVPPSAGAPFAGRLPDAHPRLIYIGRHNHVKGYDLLTEAVPPFLEAHGGAMIVAGAPGPVPAPEHRSWHELGWIAGPAALIEAGDVFILPNRKTYFDLVAIEVMALGRPILASATGGNKTLARMSRGVRLFEPSPQALGDALAAFFAVPESARVALCAENRAAFAEHFTAEAFARRYLEIIAGA